MRALGGGGGKTQNRNKSRFFYLGKPLIFYRQNIFSCFVCENEVIGLR